MKEKEQLSKKVSDISNSQDMQDTHSVESTVAGKHQPSVLARYLTDSGKGLRTEANRAFYYLVGAGLLFTVLVIPLAKFFLDPFSQKLVCLPGVLVIVLAFLRERRIQSARQKEAAPVGHDTAVNETSKADTLHKVTMRGQIPESKNYEIAMYWGFRPAAHHDLGDTIIKCKNELFVAGVGLTTISDTLNEPQVLDALSVSIKNNEAFAVTIIFMSYPHTILSQEEGRQDLVDSIKRGKRALSRFYKGLSERVPAHIRRPIVSFRTYDQNTIPRHFLLKADDVIYVGSYLGHEKGSYSYLLKIQDYREGLYALFLREIEYLKQRSVSIDIASQ
jgi:hypothetical protein